MKNLWIFAIILPALSLVHCEPVVPQKSVPQKRLIFDNHEYEPIVGTVVFGPLVDQEVSFLEDPVIGLQDGAQLGITFDLLTDQFESLSFSLVHCNKEWRQSQLRDMEFLREINDFRITTFDYSVNTVQPYISYHAQLPKPALSGNYVLKVYRRANPKDIILTRRFIVYDPVIKIDHVVRVSTTISEREKNQQIEFSIDYGELLVNTPTKDVWPVLLQNHNWYTAIGDLTPTQIRANEGVIEYLPLNLETNFPGWNEFRFADIRTLSIAGRNVAKITTRETATQAILGLDKSRQGLPYTQNFQDINGHYIIQNNDPGESLLNADYAVVQFNLKSDPVGGEVHVTGRFNNWRKNETNRMSYDADANSYRSQMLLKQGYYEYRYELSSPTKPIYLFEGSHFLAENRYEIFVYYRRPGNIHDEVLGYKSFGSIED